MAITRNEIMNIVINDKRLNINIQKNVPQKYQSDFIQHLYLQLLEMPEEKLFKAYEEKYLIHLCLRISMNNMSKTSRFWKLFRNSGSYRDNFVELNEDYTYVDDLDYEILMSNKRLYESEVLDEIDNILLRIDPVDAFLFMKYYQDGMNYTQIAKYTDVNKITITKSIKETVEYIKNNIKKC